MTIFEAITKINNLKPNGYSDGDKVAWLSELDGQIKTEIIDTHEGGENVTFAPYDEDTDTNTELLVSAPYDDMYIKWLEAKIDYSNNEYARYNITSDAFNSVYAAFARYYNRHHMPIKTKLKFF